MKAVFATAVVALVMGAATSAIADGDGPAGGTPAAASDSGGSGDGWGVASSAGVTYADTPAGSTSAVVDVNADQTVGQNYQFLDPNVLEYTQLVAGGTVMTLSGVLLQRDGDDSDAAQLDEDASGVYSSGSAALAPSLYNIVAGVGGGTAEIACTSGCDPLATSSGGGQGPVKTLASYASSDSPGSLSSAPYTGISPLGADPSTFNPSDYIPSPPPVVLVPPPSSGSGGSGTPGAPGGQTPPLTNPPSGNPGNGSAPTGGLSPPIAVPEPAIWTMMLVGFGAIGAMRRRRGERART